MVNLIGSTRTRSGLKVKAVLDTRQYAPGQEVSAEQMKGLKLKGDPFHPDWNYTLCPVGAVQPVNVISYQALMVR